MREILAYIVALIIVVALFAIGGLFFWGIGNFVCYAFKINYNWTFFCGLAVQIIAFILTSIFKK